MILQHKMVKTDKKKQSGDRLLKLQLNNWYLVKMPNLHSTQYYNFLKHNIKIQSKITMQGNQITHLCQQSVLSK